LYNPKKGKARGAVSYSADKVIRRFFRAEGPSMTNRDEIRMDVLQRLAEQAMSDPEFRAVARHDLTAALEQYGYDLNDGEIALVMRFRAALEEAGVDLFLAEKLGPEYVEQLRGALNSPR
jgi:hypothetical protein